MNESEKNIETCLPESILAEVASVPTDPQFVSLVNESLDPLKQQAFQQAGSDAYNEVVASHQPYTFTSSVRQMKSNLILLLRRLWRFPFGAGTLRSLSDMWEHYISRLQGSETYGIPSRLSQLTDLPSAPLLVADRKISNGDNTPDGISLAQSVLSTNNPITELVDNNEEWDMKAVWLSEMFPNLTRLILNCRSIATPSDSKTWLTMTSSEPIRFPSLKHITGGYYHETLLNVTTPLLDLPELIDTEQCRWGGAYDAINAPKFQRVKSYWAYQDLISSSTLRHLNLPAFNYLTSCYYYDTAMVRAAKVEDITLLGWNGAYGNNGVDVLAKNCPELLWIDLSYCTTHAWHTAVDCPKLQWVKFGKVTTFTRGAKGGGNDNVEWRGCVNLLKIEFGQDSACSIDLGTWSPTLDSSNLQQFLQNFRSFIVLRLANRKTITALTLTLSAAVYNAVTGANSGWASQHTLAELGITDNDLTDLETELGITSATIYATWLDTYTGANGIHWNVNKAN